MKQKRSRRDKKNTQKNCIKKKDLNDLDNHNDVVFHLESDILECEVKWAFLESTAANKASGGDGILRHDTIKVLH